MQSVNEVQVNVISDESGQWVLGNIVVRETWTSGVECPLVTLKGTPPGDRYIISFTLDFQKFRFAIFPPGFYIAVLNICEGILYICVCVCVCVYFNILRVW